MQTQKNNLLYNQSIWYCSSFQLSVGFQLIRGLKISGLWGPQLYNGLSLSKIAWLQWMLNEIFLIDLYTS